MYISNLKRAYELDRPFVVDGVLYIPGTRRFSDLIDDLTIPFNRGVAFSKALSDARAYLSPGVHTIVGHSLGAAVAAELSKQYGILNVGFGSPVANDINYADVRDPIGMFVRSNALPNNSSLHHSVEGYIIPQGN